MGLFKAIGQFHKVHVSSVYVPGMPVELFAMWQTGYSGDQYAGEVRAYVRMQE